MSRNVLGSWNIDDAHAAAAELLAVAVMRDRLADHSADARVYGCTARSRRQALKLEANSIATGLTAL